MHIQSCLEPKLIRNSRTNELMYVPCGRCSACLKARSYRWVERLNQERYCWKYAVFFTLTYDSEHLPLLVKTDSSHYVDIHHRLTPPYKDVSVLDTYELFYKFCTDKEREKRWLIALGDNLPSLSSYDLQCFIKRYRTNLSRLYERKVKQFSTFKERIKPTFRYFAIGEYGSTLLRPHYHGIFFFNSEFQASHVEELISKSWQFGRIDCSFVSDTNSSYVAGYLNSLSNLPSVYRDKHTRPFFLCSKFPPIGTLCHSSKEIKEMFFSGTTDQIIFDHKKGVFDNVPLWRTFVDRLYPKLSAFSELSHRDRVTLYRIVEVKNFGSFSRFKLWLYSPSYKVERSTFIEDYKKYLESNCDDLNSALQRWYYISARVCKQAESFEISVSDYVSFIENFYQNVEKNKLKQFYEFQSNYVEQYDLCTLAGLDSLWLRGLLDLDVSDVSAEELEVLSSYGVDVNKFFSENYSERFEYQQKLLPYNTWDYHVFSLDCESWMNRAQKSKIKNEYLQLHPDLKNIIY